MNSILVRQLCLVFMGLVLANPLSANESLAAPGEPRVRKFKLDYAVTISGPAAGTKLRVWLPEARSDNDQKVTVLSRKLPPSAQVNTERMFGNRIVHFEVPMPASGSLSCQVSYLVERRELLGLPGEQNRRPMNLSEAERRLHLAPNRKIPLDGKPLQLLANTRLPQDQLALGRFFYNMVDRLVEYDKSKPGFGTGDAEWVCDSRFGNCTDFHSLFIAWARSQKLPARFEIGFPLPDRRGEGEINGYHCWAFFYVDGHGWTPVDISEADKNPAMKEYYFGHLTENRVTFTNGRDIELVPRQSGEPLNFFIYPYVEVDGKELPKDQVKLNVSFKDECSPAVGRDQ